MPAPFEPSGSIKTRESAASTSPVSPVRGGTLPWGELRPKLEATGAVPWPAQEDIPPASAVRGGTLPWGTCLDELVAEDARDTQGARDASAATSSRVPPPSTPKLVTLDDLLSDSLRPVRLASQPVIVAPPTGELEPTE